MLNNPSGMAFSVANNATDSCSLLAPPAAHQHRIQSQQHQSNSGNNAADLDGNCNDNNTNSMTCRQNQAAAWTLMGILPQQNTSQSQVSPRSSFFGESSNQMHIGYSNNEGDTCKDQNVNSALYQMRTFPDRPSFQDLDMIASIVAKEQAMLKINSNAARVDHSRISGLSLAHNHHAPVIVNGSRENLSSSPSEMSPTSCSPSSSDTVHSGRRTNMRPEDDTGGGATHRHNSDSPIDVTGLVNSQTPKQEAHFDMSGILGMSQINGHLQNAALNSGTSSSHLLSSSTSLGSFVGLSYHQQHGQQHSNGSSTSAASQLQSPTEVGASTATTAMTRPRHRSSQHDGLLKCIYCPKKWADQTALRVHMDECRVLRMHECQQCGKRFKARGGLQQHMRIHSHDRPYQCHFCPKRFTQKSHVDQHERIHTGAKPFSCQFCGRAFRQRSQQMGHEATHASGVLSVAANIANQQQLQLNAESPLNCASEEHSPNTLDGSSSASHSHQQRQVNAGNSANSGERLLPSVGSGMVAHNAVTSLLALSQGGGMPMPHPPQTLSEALASRGGGV